jgi:hypothetical protein
MFRESLTVGEEANIDNLGLSGVNWRGRVKRCADEGRRCESCFAG